MRYAAATKKILPRCAVTGTLASPGVLPAQQPGALKVPTSLFHHISTVVGGRKELADIIERTKSLIDQQITGVKKDPIEQCRFIIRRLVATGYKEVADELKAVVFTEEEVTQLRNLAAKGQPK